MRKNGTKSETELRATIVKKVYVQEFLLKFCLRKGNFERELCPKLTLFEGLNGKVFDRLMKLGGFINV